MPTSPDPGSAPILDPRAMAQQLLANQPVDEKNQPFVPLWQTRPHATAQQIGVANKYDAMDHELGIPVTTPSRDVLTGADTVHTGDYADSAFLDMTPEEQHAFRDKAIKAGMIKEDATPAQIIQAWQNAVSQAEKYNKARPDDKNKWISPFEAVDKLGVSQAADLGVAFDAFSRNVQNRTYNQDEVKGNAIPILQRELGRDPTAGEIQAFTAAINHASMLNPTITTSEGLDINGNPATSQAAVHTTVQNTTGGIDPNQILLDQVRSSPEHAQYDAAAKFYPAILAALDSVV